MTYCRLLFVYNILLLVHKIVLNISQDMIIPPVTTVSLLLFVLYECCFLACILLFFFLSRLYPLSTLCSTSINFCISLYDVQIIGLSNILTMGVLDEGYYRNASCTLNYISMVLLQSPGDTSAASELLITDCIIRPVVSVSWFIY